VLGHGLYVMQNFANANPRYQNRLHAGVDISWGNDLESHRAAGMTVLSHLHFEVRDFPYWSDAKDFGGTDRPEYERAPTPDNDVICAGRGYKPRGNEALPTLRDYGWRDFRAHGRRGHRPTAQSDQGLRGEGRVTKERQPDLSQSADLRPLEIARSGLFYRTAFAAEAMIWRRANDAVDLRTRRERVARRASAGAGSEQGAY